MQCQYIKQYWIMINRTDNQSSNLSTFAERYKATCWSKLDVLSLSYKLSTTQTTLS